MTERAHLSAKARSFFDGLWSRGDPWELEASEFERNRYRCLMAMLDRPKYGRVLEIGCGAGTFTHLLAPMADSLPALVVMSETVYYLGWLYSFYDLCWMASELFKSTRNDGALLLANAQGEVCGPLMHPNIIRAYEHLFASVGYRFKFQEIFRGNKNGVDLEIAILLLSKTVWMGADTAGRDR